MLTFHALHRSVLRLSDIAPSIRDRIGRLARCSDRYRQRCDLAELDDRLLRDIGLSRAQAEAEYRKPPWE